MKEKQTDTIFLCGFMGAGKSATGKALARQINCHFYDLDKAIEQKSGRLIKQIFGQEGEAYFRQLEREMVQHFIKKNKCIVALGGGTLQDEALTAKIKSSGLLIFIKCPFPVIFKRINNSKNRPLLLNNDGSLKEKDRLSDELKSLYNQRLPLYRRADITAVNNGNLSPTQMAQYIAQKITEYGPSI